MQAASPPNPARDAPPGYRLAGYAPVPEPGYVESPGPGFKWVNNQWLYAGSQAPPPNPSPTTYQLPFSYAPPGYTVSYAVLEAQPETEFGYQQSPEEDEIRGTQV